MKLKYRPNVVAAKDRRGPGRVAGAGPGRRGRARGLSSSCEESAGEEGCTDHEKEGSKLLLNVDTMLPGMYHSSDS